MSQAHKHVLWCLNKAKKELSEKGKHRGLIIATPDLEKAAGHITKAEHNLAAISYFDKGGFSDWSASAAFYAMYHCFLAILAKFGYESRNQECTISAVEYLKEQGKIELDERFILALKSEVQEMSEQRIIDLREYYQYSVKTNVEDEEKIKKLVEISSEMIDAAKEIIYEKK
ncbi:MAG: HEPN domain-containing protein [Nanoarchaeota archaeon]